MKNGRAFLIMALAVLLGLGAVALASRWLLRQGPGSAGKVVLAAADVNLGQRLTPEMLKLSDWPADSLPQGALQDPLKLSGRVLKSSVLRGEPLTEAKLAPVGTVGGLSALITEGKRAITVRVNDVVGVAGFALPGNYVDVIVYTQRDRGAAVQAQAQDPSISKIVLERILVLAVAQEVGRDDTKPRVVNAVTLEVTPAQAENLDLARSVGTLSLALRNQIDPAPGVTGGATKVTLLGERPAAAPPAAAAPAAVAAVAPAAAPPAAPQKVALVQRRCSAVIDGLRLSQECF
ncbi:pilus assembly protein CpaB [Janthinobacterium sp. CG_23.3]|uniref:Flp pilus assembly protein CpaB n=1 Tax=unclassified Janthinobacterium TaxID=2610881 RepID=UPI000346B443|nr:MULTISPECIES: Flp pilus assembly protein CpaB [unclassified Janthinobacterium]MEC5158915.1 pilus assembly protein CpaB [Janthinobacterium sp. CG_S6]